jgi:uncharacterized protein YkwD
MNTRHPSVLFLAMAIVVLAVGASATGQEEPDAGSVAVGTCTGETIDLNSHEKRMLDLHNLTRADYGLQPLCVHPALTGAARAHSQEMLDGGFFGHESLDGGNAGGRLEGFGYTSYDYSYWEIGENIAWGTGRKALPDDRFDEWMGSSEHWPNILSEDFQEIGIGVRTGESYDDGTMYTADFGTRG